MKSSDQRSIISRLLGVIATIFVLIGAQPVSAVLMWEPLASFLDPRTGTGIEGSAASLIGGKIHVSHGFRGGDTLFLSIYDIATNTWTHGGPSAPNAAIVRSEGAGGTALGKHYSIGGRPGVPGPGNAVEEFTPGGGWVTKSVMTTPRRGLGTASVGGKIYAAGGDSGGAPGGPANLGGVFQVFDPTVGVGGTWTTLALMPVPITDAEATIGLTAAQSGSVAGRVYVFGGRNALGAIVSTTQIYDIATNTWSLGAPMSTARANAMAGVIDLGVSQDGSIAVFGGFAGGPNLTVTEFYNPLTNIWSAGPAMLFPTSEMAVGMLWDSSGIYSIGSGIFGASAMVVERLVNVAEPSMPALFGLGALLLLAVTRIRRRGLW